MKKYSQTLRVLGNNNFILLFYKDINKTSLKQNIKHQEFNKKKSNQQVGSNEYNLQRPYIKKKKGGKKTNTNTNFKLKRKCIDMNGLIQLSRIMQILKSYV